MLADRVKNRGRRTVELSRNATANLVDAALALPREPPRPAEDLVALAVIHLREIRPARDLVAVRREEALDAADQEPDAPLPIREHEPPRRQPAPPPALDRLARDVEPLGHVLDHQHRLAERRRRHVERLANALDQQPKVMLKRDPGQQLFEPRVFRVKPRDPERDEVERISLPRLDVMQELLRSRHLVRAGLGGRKLQLPRERSEIVDAELRHAAIIRPRQRTVNL
jgi:hypothetical protein